MSKILASQIKHGQFLAIDNKLWRVNGTERAKPGKGGAFIQVDTKSIDNISKRHKFRSDEDVELARLDEENGTYLYKQQDEYYFLNVVTNDILSINRSDLDDLIELLEPNSDVKLLCNEGALLVVELPPKITCKVDEILSGSGEKGGAKAVSIKGVRFLVPQYIQVGEHVIISTIDRTFAQRAKGE